MNYFAVDPEELFYNEILLIRSRHEQFFPEDQLEKIKLIKTPVGYELKFLDGYDLDEGIGLEIDLAFSLIFT